MNAELFSVDPVVNVSARKEPFMNSRRLPRLRALALGLLLAAPAMGWAFSSGSSGADGVLAPTVNTEVVLPPSGVLNYTSINIPTGVTVTFRKNTTNTPVVLLVSGDAVIVGAINISGKPGLDSGAAGSGNLGDDGTPGEGGPGGFGGGRGGLVAASAAGGGGFGPGGGGGGSVCAANPPYITGGAGGTYASGGEAGYSGWCGGIISTGPIYGSSALLPLIGGSGGGGGMGGSTFAGTGGGGAGGALLIAASGTINVAGSISANGHVGGATNGAGCGASGGSGSGGAIRLVATTIAGNGTLSAVGNARSATVSCASSGLGNGYGGAGGTGRIRLESEFFTRTAASNPAHSFAAPGPIFIAGLPTLAITTVAGIAVPASPAGVADVSLPAATTNPVTIGFQTTGVPVGNTVTVKLTPAYGATSSAVSTALTGSTASATATASITLPSGPSTLQATLTYTIVASLGDILSRYAQNERVEKITLSAAPGGASKATLITVSGKEYEAPAEALQIAALGQ